MFKAEIEKV